MHGQTTQTIAPFESLKSNVIHFLLTISGFSFWFFMAVPFALHRESYVWFTWAGHDSLVRALGTITATWRPLAQTATWLGFLALDPQVFPTSPVRQAILQCMIYALFALAWLIIYSASPQRRVLSIVAFVAGGVFFSGYIHLFHIYGLFYLPVLVIVALMLRLHSMPGERRGEAFVIFLAMVLVLWHPFATAIFLGFYFGRYLSTLGELSTRQHLRTWAVLVFGAGAVLASLVLSPRVNQTFNPFGFIATYQTNEVNGVASLIALMLALVTAFSMDFSARLKFVIAAGIAATAMVFWSLNLPIILLWVGVAALKLVISRNWELAVPLVVTALLPYGAGIGAPVYALYTITLTVFVTGLGWTSAEAKLRTYNYAPAGVALLMVLGVAIVSVRTGVSVPVVSQFAQPLLAERERTYQLEEVLSWLAASDYCRYGVTFATGSEDPVESVSDALVRRYRPPARL